MGRVDVDFEAQVFLADQLGEFLDQEFLGQMIEFAIGRAGPVADGDFALRRIILDRINSCFLLQVLGLQAKWPEQQFALTDENWVWWVML